MEEGSLADMMREVRAAIDPVPTSEPNAQLDRIEQKLDWLHQATLLHHLRMGWDPAKPPLEDPPWPDVPRETSTPSSMS